MASPAVFSFASSRASFRALALSSCFFPSSPAFCRVEASFATAVSFSRFIAAFLSHISLSACASGTPQFLSAAILRRRRRNTGGCANDLQQSAGCHAVKLGQHLLPRIRA